MPKYTTITADENHRLIEFTTIPVEEHHRLIRESRDCEAMRQALRVIHTWASFDCDEELNPSHAVALDGKQVLALCDKALKGAE
jgi:hypothetical protein